MDKVKNRDMVSYVLKIFLISTTIFWSDLPGTDITYLLPEAQSTVGSLKTKPYPEFVKQLI
ncbi:MAG: hypothetical protein ACFFG0_30735 [Candidatus Thorarchaeota archaeon]